MTDPLDDAPTRLDRGRTRLDRALTALGLVGPFRRDAALAVAVAAVTAALVALTGLDPRLGEIGFGTAALTTAVAGVVVQSLLLCLRRVAPTACLGAVVAVQVVLTVVLPLGGGVHGPATSIAAYTCGRELPARRAAWAVGVAAVTETAAFVLVDALRAEPSRSTLTVVALVLAQVFAAALTYLGAGLLGAHLATRHRYVELVRLRAHEAVTTQQARVRAAIGLERTRMARELHDIAAHHLTGMVVQAAVVEKLIDRDPERAKETAARVRVQGRHTLADLRLVVGALREEGAADGGAPVPGLAELDRLVATARELGTPVELVRDGPARALPPFADVTAYRVAQEALANARDHAPGVPVRVLVRHGAADLTLDVVNPGPVPPGTGTGPDRGFGLVGMRERAQLLGAEFAAGPTPDGGWRVRLVVPSDPAEER